VLSAYYVYIWPPLFASLSGLVSSWNVGISSYVVDYEQYQTVCFVHKMLLWLAEINSLTRHNKLKIAFAKC